MFGADRAKGLRTSGVPAAVLRLPIILPLILTLAACGEEAKPDPRIERDTVVAAALDDPIMADPDLASQNRGNTALSVADQPWPKFRRTSEPPKRLSGQGQRLRNCSAGGSRPHPLRRRPCPNRRLARAVTMQGVAQALGLGGAGCPAKLGYGFIWAARLPAGLPVYPRGHTRVAAGADDAACKVRVVRFASPASVADLTDFYYASAVKSGLAPQRRKEGNDEVVAGTKGAASYAVYIRTGADGLSEVDLATSGF